MTEVPFALSISHFVNSVGADAGFAAIIGLAILILLYFAQARETATLRDQAETAAEQVQQLEYRLAQLQRGMRPPVAPAPTGQRAVAPAAGAALGGPERAVAAAAPAASRVAPPARPALPIAPAGLGAPALASATRLIPAGEDEIRVHAGPAREEALVGAAAGASTAAARASGTDAAPGSPPSSRSGAAVLDPPGPPTSTPAGGANGGTRPPAPVGAAPGPGAPAGSASAPATSPSPRPGPAPARPAPAGAPSGAQSRQGTLPPRTGRPASAPPRGTPPERSGLRSALFVVGGLVAVAAVVVALLALTSSGNSTPQSSSSTSPISNAPGGRTHHKGKGKTKAKTVSTVQPASVTVAVLNGTSTTNLAHDISLRLSGSGYKPGTIATASDQTQTATVVGYLPGQRQAAAIVAHSLNLPPSSIQPVTQANQAVACPSAGTCSAQVIVTVGSDLASAASSASQSSAASSTG